MDKPSLPDLDWPPVTQEWFQAWRDLPATDEWDATKWQYLFTTALAHAQVWGNGDMTKLPELRSREQYMWQVIAEQQGDTAKPAGAQVKRVSTPLDEVKARREARIKKQA